MMTVFVGDILNATAASVSAGPTSSRTWQWFRSGTAIPAATTTSYRVTEADINAALTVRQGESNFMGSAFAMSDPTATVGAWSPSALFALAEPGVWYDPSDLTTLFQDTAGTTPVTTPGQTVALALDKSKGLVLGPELVTNGDFSNGSTGWTLGAGWSVTGGAAVRDSTAGGSNLSGGAGVEIGKTYRITWTQTGSSFVAIYLGGLSGPLVSNSNIAGTYSVLVAATVTGGIVFRASAAVSGVDNISVRELPGFHATQATTASRPTYGIVPLGGRRNLLTRTEEFDNAAWGISGLTRSTNSAVSPNGQTTADTITGSSGTNAVIFNDTAVSLTSGAHTASCYVKAGTASHLVLSIWQGSGTLGINQWFNLQTGAIGSSSSTSGYAHTGGAIVDVGSGWYRITVSGTVPSGLAYWSLRLVDGDNAFVYTNTVGDTALIWGAQLETGSTATAYQRVGSQFDVTEAGVQSLGYLSFDGVDDFLVTPTITPGTDKAQVFAGVRKLSDAALGALAELSADSGSNSGSFGVFAPGSISAAIDDFGATLNGSAFTGGRFNGYDAPTTRVISSLFDISQATAATEITFRANGSTVPSDGIGGLAANAGTGNFLAYPLYIGRRGGTSVPFNGNLFSLIVRFGANLSTSVINRAEYYVSNKTGVTL